MKLLTLTATLGISAGFLTAAPADPRFQQSVQPLLQKNCAMCHNENTASGGLNLNAFLAPSSLTAQRDGWERIVAKLRSGEMPPKGLPKPSAPALEALLKYVEGDFDRQDKALKPNPGRVTARRLNRAEYGNTIRDLLGVHFRADEEFPADDSGFGFDNIGNVLTVSPALMQKYLSAAEKISSLAVGADPMPKPGLFDKRNKVRRKGPSAIGFSDIIEFDADYNVRALIIGHRGPEGKPVNLVISVDGKPVKTVEVPSVLTLVTKQAGATQRVTEEVRVHLTAGPHTFSAVFENDELPKDLPANMRLNNSRNMFPDTMEIAGPFESKEPRASRKKILICDPAMGAACVDRIVTTLAKRAFRRPVTKLEVADLVKVYNLAKTAGYTPEQSVQFTIQAVLVSPKFLFRIEKDPPAGVVRPLADLELASRLSYFLWSSMPDDELLALAEANKLHLKPVLDAQLKRMLADSKSSALAENFVGQWLETRSLDAAKPDRTKFPDWGPELKEAMRTETRMFFEAILRENRPISDFLDGNYTFVNEQLAKHYGIEGVTGSEFRRVELPVGQRSGVLTQASVLTVSSYASRTSVVLRGKYILENILGSAPPPAPPDVPALDEAATGTTRSLRQQMEAHRSSPVCASCHARMDPLGFGLENYDAIGRWRTQDGKFPVDASGTFPNGGTFTTPAEMKTLLKNDMPEFLRCLTEKMLIYSLGRGVERMDRPTVQEIGRQTISDGYKLQTLISGIVHSLPFTARRGELIESKEVASR